MNRLEILEEEIKKYMDRSSGFYVEYLRTKKYGYQKIEKNFIGENVLELGSDGAATTSILVRWSKRLTIVDMVDKVSALLDEEIKRAKFVKSKWEEYTPKELYSDILLTDSLEHVENPVEILSLVSNWLSSEGRVHIIVPNALSLHRLIGVEMGLLDSPYSFNQNDIRAGHKRVYDIDTLQEDIKSAGLKIEEIRGIQLKPLSDSQLVGFSEEYKDALECLSNICDRHCAEIYAFCKRA